MFFGSHLQYTLVSSWLWNVGMAELYQKLRISSRNKVKNSFRFCVRKKVVWLSDKICTGRDTCRRWYVAKPIGTSSCRESRAIRICKGTSIYGVPLNFPMGGASGRPQWTRQGLRFRISGLKPHKVTYIYEADRNFGCSHFRKSTCECQAYRVCDIFTDLALLTYTTLWQKHEILTYTRNYEIRNTLVYCHH